MSRTTFLHLDTGAWGRSILQVMRSWWFMVHFGAVVLVMALSPSTYSKTHRATTAQYIYASTWQVLPWFTAMAALLSLVLIRVVVVTALSYGLSQYALQMVVRVLVLELIPLSAAMFVALRAGLAFNAGATDIFSAGFLATVPEARAGLDDKQLGAATRELKTLQRLYQVTPMNEAIPVLRELGLTSAHDIAAYRPGEFADLFNRKYAERFKVPPPPGTSEVELPQPVMSMNQGSTDREFDAFAPGWYLSVYWM